MPLFDRAISVVVGTPGTAGLALDEFDMSCAIEKDAEGEPNLGVCQVYGLTETTRSKLKAGQDVMIIRAGYRESDQGLRQCCALDVFDVRVEYKPPDVITTISGGDGIHTRRNNQTLSVSYSGGRSAKAIIRDIASRIGATLQDSAMSGLTDETFANGFSEAGPLQDVLTRVCGRINAIWSFQDGKLQICSRNSPVGSSVVVLNQDTGLLERPVKRTKIQSFYVPAIRPGWVVKSLLNPMIVPNGRVRLQSDGVDAIYRVLHVKHDIATRGNEFFTTADIAEW